MVQAEEKLPCVFGLIDECKARRFVEESEASPILSSSETEAKVVEKALENTKALQFNDKKTAKEMGEAMAEGVIGKMLGPLMQGMKPSKAMLLAKYCDMCPTLFQERVNTRPVPSIPPRVRAEAKSGDEEKQ